MYKLYISLNICIFQMPEGTWLSVLGSSYCRAALEIPHTECRVHGRGERKKDNLEERQRTHYKIQQSQWKSSHLSRPTENSQNI